MRFQITTLGCPKNTVDSEMMAELLAQAGHFAVDEPRQADVLIVNTCGFIEAARAESYAMLQEIAAAKSRRQRLIVAGCLAQRYGEEIRRQVPHVDAIIGTRSWPEIVALFERLDRPGREMAAHVQATGNLVTSVRRSAVNGATAYVKIADGCDASCSFCAIPLIKGRQQSKPPDDIVREVAELAEAGTREMILIAQNTTAYGRDLGLRDELPRLLRRIADVSPGPDWIRLLYAYPQDVSPALIEAMAALPAMCHYLDLPLQHAHPDVLRRMRRPYEMERVYSLIADLQEAMPDLSLRSTFIVGFPGETDAEFEALLDFMAEIAFDKAGVFAYSAEEDTAAADLPGRVPAEVIAERYERAMLLQQDISLFRNEEQVGQVLPVLIEGTEEGLSVGRSYRDAPEIDGVVLMAGEYPAGEFVPARIVEAQPYDLVAEPA
jgi:ribosomal protein S12 methylthiotransferase